MQDKKATQILWNFKTRIWDLMWIIVQSLTLWVLKESTAANQNHQLPPSMHKNEMNYWNDIKLYIKHMEVTVTGHTKAPCNISHTHFNTFSYNNLPPPNSNIPNFWVASNNCYSKTTWETFLPPLLLTTWNCLATECWSNAKTYDAGFKDINNCLEMRYLGFLTGSVGKNKQQYFRSQDIWTFLL